MNDPLLTKEYSSEEHGVQAVVGEDGSECRGPGLAPPQ